MHCYKVIIGLLLYFGNSFDRTDSSISTDFNEFKQKFNKKYSVNEEETRKNNFMSNKLSHEELKFEPYLGATYGETKFWDLTPEEFKDLYLSDIISIREIPLLNPSTPTYRFKDLGIPDKIDWRTKLIFSAISPVKNQKKCGGCWAFSTVETVESMYSIQTGTSPPVLSVQEVIDCASNNYGCRGGDTCRALEWMVRNQSAIVPESVYPLTDESNPCRKVPDPKGAVFVHNYTCENNVGKEDRILQMLQAGPVAAAVDATTWYNYQGGIIQYHCGIYDNHAVQIVGYDLTGDVPHYIIRNSWGTDFGNGGYIYIKIGGNVCGIAQRVSAVFVEV